MLLEFNVEDLLALPQLKQGKFTKNIAYVDIMQAINEIASIMEYKTDKRGIEVKCVSTGFPTIQ